MAAKVTFDTANKLIICKAGVTELDVRVDLYSDAKEDWKSDANLNKFVFPFDVVGGNVTDPITGNVIPTYLFLKTGWRIRPQEANHTLNVKGGILVGPAGGDPFVDTLGAYTVRIRYSQPVKADTIIFGSGLSVPEHDQLMAASKEATVNSVKEYILQIRERNIRRYLVRAVADDATRNVSIDDWDHEVVIIKADSDPDWSSPVDTGQRKIAYEQAYDQDDPELGHERSFYYIGAD